MLCRAVKIAHFIQKYGILNKKISELLRKALRGKKLLEPFFAFGEIHSNPQTIFHIRYFLYCMENSLADIHPELVCEWSDSNLPLIPPRYSNLRLKKCGGNARLDIRGKKRFQKKR
jgi:hypothetical protein